MKTNGISLEDMEDGYSKPISTSDAANMLRRKIDKNARPYETTAITLNNRKVDAWKKEVLDKIANTKRTVPAGRVWESWKLYEEGTNIMALQELKDAGFVPTVNSDVIEFWKVFFEKSTVEELHNYGTGTVSTGWGIIQNYLKMWFAEQKYEKLFSQYNNPLDWEKNYHAHSQILRGEILPFWDPETLKEIHQKVGTILSTQVQPDYTPGYSRMM